MDRRTLAARSGCSESQIGHLETGRRRTTPAPVAHAIAEALTADIRALFTPATRRALDRGHQLRTAREHAGLSQPDAARLARVTVTTWWRIEHAGAVCSAGIAGRVADAIGVQARDVFGAVESGPWLVLDPDQLRKAREEA